MVTIRKYIGNKSALSHYKDQEVAFKQLGTILNINPIIGLLAETVATKAKDLKHPNIIEILGIVYEHPPTAIYGLVMEYCPDRSLHHRLHFVISKELNL